MTADPFEQRLKKACAGDADALGELLDHQRPELRRLAVEQLPPVIQKRIDASDLVQQTCLSVFRSLKDFEGIDPAQFVAWVRKIHERNIQNTIRDQLLAQRRAAVREAGDAESDGLADPGPSPSQLVRFSEERTRLLGVLRQLPDDEQAILQLRYWEGCTLVEICERLDLTRDAAAWLIHKALRRAKTFLS